MGKQILPHLDEEDDLTARTISDAACLRSRCALLTKHKPTSDMTGSTSEMRQMRTFVRVR